MTAYAALHLVPVEVVKRLHADRGTSRQWVWENIRSSSVRSARMHAFDDFVRRWPRLQDWFAAPLRQRLLDGQGCVRGQHPHGGASVIMPT